MTLEADIAATFSADGAEPFVVDAAFEVERGETVTVLGPSGSGKTLLLESVAGFHAHDGHVTLDGRPVSDRPPEKRDFGFVFQDYALFPHATVSENVAFGQRYLGSSWWERAGALAAGDDRRSRLRALVRDDGRSRRERLRHLTRLQREGPDAPDPARLLEAFGIDDLADRYPPTLSGGERQRVALARALAVEPEVLLLDEPLSSLDVPTRQSLRQDLQDVLADVTAVYVTHNRTTARALSDRIVVMNDGRVVQSGSPEAVFERPASPMVARFTGANCVRLADVPGLRDRLDVTAEYVAIRPEAVGLADDGDLRGTVERVVREDATSRVTVDAGEARIEALTGTPPAVGADVALQFPRDRLHPVS